MVEEASTLKGVTLELQTFIRLQTLLAINAYPVMLTSVLNACSTATILTQ